MALLRSALLVVLLAAGAATVSAAATLPEALKGFPDLSELAALLQKNPGAYVGEGFTGTLLAPTNQAFKALRAAAKDEGVKLDATTTLQILLYHVLPTSYKLADLADGTSAPTNQGTPVEVKYVDGKPLFVGKGSVAGIAAISRNLDIGAGNAVMHVIDTVLLPTELFKGQKLTVKGLVKADKAIPAPTVGTAASGATAGTGAGSATAGSNTGAAVDAASVLPGVDAGLNLGGDLLSGPITGDLLDTALAALFEANLTSLITWLDEVPEITNLLLSSDFAGTLFAPTNAAIDKWLNALKPKATPQPIDIRSVLLAHLVNDTALFASDFEDGQELTTVADTKLIVDVRMRDGRVQVTDEQGNRATLANDLPIGRSAINIIDRVLAPAELLSAETEQKAPEAPAPVEVPAVSSAVARSLAALAPAALLAAALLA
ncbi:beta-Ig-H3 fasciclin [Chlorella sorokiniana]|uniref:Beta-Ig-H3 fasciclin n=1 Tax=Chlorella sorokiniana TaxID=3076 RepID=A0A2P6TE57_CHLSO|nr:beta-Ig-H3 fasciclin [Chlorella sorokiniana]|eukprot:PRW20912.1 beta-Ig-H3 fasciclin [Chlorella sorokiniana]